MPRYDYLCPKCGQQFEVSRLISRSADPALCPNDGEQGERMFVAPTIIMKGGATPTAWEQLRSTQNSEVADFKFTGG